MKNAFPAFLALILISFPFASCTKQTKSVQESTDEIILTVGQPEENGTEGSGNLSRWNRNEGIVCVVFGYGFNGESFYTETKEMLKEEFGLVQDGGIILPLLYPDDFKNRIANFYDIANEQNLRGIILLGAPEKTHISLAKLQDDWEGKPNFSVFSFFPQDDILGEESTSDFVLEYARGVTDEANDGETELKIDKDTEEILSRAVTYIMELPSPLESNSDLIHHVQFIAGNRKVHRYIDSETGLQSINHFVMEEN